MNGTPAGDFEQTLLLFGAQVSVDGQFALKFVVNAVHSLAILAILHMDFAVFDACRRRLQVDLLAHGVHVQRHRCAAREGRK